MRVFKVAASNINSFYQYSDYENNDGDGDTSNYCSSFSLVLCITTNSHSMSGICRLSVTEFKKVPCFFANIVILSCVLSEIIDSAGTQVFTQGSSSLLLA